MAAKMDKDALKKNQFWIALGVFAVVWLAAVVMVKTSADASTKKKEWEDAEKAIKGVGRPKNDSFLGPWEKYGDKFRAHKNVVWKQAWEIQKDMYDWPERMAKETRVPQFPGDPFGPRDATGKGDPTVDLNIRSKFKTDWYKEQFPPYRPLDQLVAPAEFLGGFFAVFPMQQWHPTHAPTVEEVWLAQEDYWVRREMLYMIRQALDSVALLKEVKPEKEKEKEKLPDGIVTKRVFRNANWELTLLMEKDENGRTWIISDKSTIKNIHPRQTTQQLVHPKSNKGLPFRLIQKDNNSFFPFEIAGEPLAYGKSANLKQLKTSPVNLQRDFFVEQVLEWEISPIRRIDRLEVAWHSHRTVTSGLKVNEELKKLEPPPLDDGGGTTVGMGEMAGGMMGMMGGMVTPGVMLGGGPGGVGGQAGPRDGTRINKIERQRYLYVTPQCKHLPIGIRLIVDQSHIHDVLTAVSNSRLRIQITQVTMHHERNIPRGGKTGTPGGMGAMGAGMMGGMMGGPPPRPTTPYVPPTGRPFVPSGMTGGFPGRPILPGPGGMGERGAPTSVESTIGFMDNAQLVELSIYGIASLYERYRDQPKTSESSTGTTP